MQLPSIPMNYQSSPKEISFSAKYCTHIYFYLRMGYIVATAGMTAKKGLYTTERWIQDSLDTLHVVEDIGGKINIEGIENFKDLEKPCIFVANHMSTLETFTLPIMIQPYKDVTYVVKSSLEKYPFFGPVIASRQPILLDRTNPREDFAKVMTVGLEILNSGRSLIIFPQGTRTKVFEDAGFNSLGVKLARKANVPVVPVALKTNVWGTGSIIKDMGKINPKLTAHFSFGEALTVEGNGKEEHTKCLDFIRGSLEKWEKETV